MSQLPLWDREPVTVASTGNVNRGEPRLAHRPQLFFRTRLPIQKRLRIESRPREPEMRKGIDRLQLRPFQFASRRPPENIPAAARLLIDDAAADTDCEAQRPPIELALEERRHPGIARSIDASRHPTR